MAIDLPSQSIRVSCAALVVRDMQGVSTLTIVPIVDLKKGEFGGVKQLGINARRSIREAVISVSRQAFSA